MSSEFNFCLKTKGLIALCKHKQNATVTFGFLLHKWLLVVNRKGIPKLLILFGRRDLHCLVPNISVVLKICQINKDGDVGIFNVLVRTERKKTNFPLFVAICVTSLSSSWSVEQRKTQTQCISCYRVYVQPVIKS